MAAEPLGKYLAKRKDLYFYSESTACGRGFMGDWAVKGDKLYLINLKANLNFETKVGVDYLFPGQKEIFAEWFTGEIRIPTGKMLRYAYMGYASVYEKDIFLKFEKGKLVDERIVDNRESDD